MIITNDEDALRVKCEPVLSHEVGPLRDQLERELARSTALGKGGIGLACPQIGINKNFCIVRIDNVYKVDLVNCRIEKGYDKAIFENEGCLSFPGRYEKTIRYQEIYVVENMVEPFSFISKGLMAVVCQHELDHVNGILLPDVALKPKINKKIRPNDKCPCKSGLKFKKCCGSNSKGI